MVSVNLEYTFIQLLFFVLKEIVSLNRQYFNLQVAIFISKNIHCQNNVFLLQYSMFLWICEFDFQGGIEQVNKILLEKWTSIV